MIPPSGVVVHYVDGRQIPVQVMLVGVEGGVAVWENITPLPDGLVVGVESDPLPLLTSVRLTSRSYPGPLPG